MAQTRETVTQLPDNEITWCGLKLTKKSSEDFFSHRGPSFGWEVDASLDDADEYEARVYFQGIKLTSGKGATRYAALTKTLQELSVLESKIGNEAYSRREGGRAHKARRG